ncbi:MAG: phosphoenolpyruvate--protein phosphotransferase [Oscillospiraceae bacterium]|nr:phosphoenolpyruvate--protein phosphotransferase [Oscillospiraceae bacterium]
MRGIIAAPGMAMASAHLVSEPEINVRKREISDVLEELERLRCALAECSSQIEGIMDSMDGSVDPQTIEILDFQLLLLEDTDFIGEIDSIVTGQSINAEYAVKSASENYMSKLNNITDNDYLRERAADVADLSQRLIAVLSGVDMEIAEPDEPYIAIGRDIAVSRVAVLDRDKLKGIILESGGVTSHCVILSRSLGIPCMIRTQGILGLANQGDTILLDAVSGEVIINPDLVRVQAYNDYAHKEEAKKTMLKEYVNRKSMSLDGAEMKVYANITMSSEAENVVHQGGEGVGLFRSELLFMAQTVTPPSEETQYAEYSKTAKALGDRPLVIRTLDIGGDKLISYMDIGEEENPFLGYRAIRYCLDHPEIFKPQISAIMRAGADGNVWMMFPMITCVDELIKAKQFVEQVGLDLREKGIPYDPNIKIGMMMETPAAAMDATILAKEVDFFSIGTNDLAQYLFAADRANSKLSYLNSPFQPALLRIINRISKAAAEAGIEVDICGQAAEVEALTPIWLAMGITNLSVSIPCVTSVRKRICQLDKADCVGLLEVVLNLETADEVEKVLIRFAERNIIHDN